MFGADVVTDLRKHALLQLVIVTIVMAATAGWISNANSKALCQRQVASWLLAHIGPESSYLLDADDESMRACFDSRNATFAVVASNPDDPNAWPRCP